MTWQEALDIIEKTDPHAWRLRWLCGEDYPHRLNREAYRRRVIIMAGGTPGPMPPPPRHPVACHPRRG